MSHKGEAFDSNCMTLTRFVLQEQRKFKVRNRLEAAKVDKIDEILLSSMQQVT